MNTHQQFLMSDYSDDLRAEAATSAQLLGRSARSLPPGVPPHARWSWRAGPWMLAVLATADPEGQRKAMDRFALSKGPIELFAATRQTLI